MPKLGCFSSKGHSDGGVSALQHLSSGSGEEHAYAKSESSKTLTAPYRLKSGVVTGLEGQQQQQRPGEGEHIEQATSFESDRTASSRLSRRNSAEEIAAYIASTTLSGTRRQPPHTRRPTISERVVGASKQQQRTTSDGSSNIPAARTGDIRAVAQQPAAIREEGPDEDEEQYYESEQDDEGCDSDPEHNDEIDAIMSQMKMSKSCLPHRSPTAYLGLLGPPGGLDDPTKVVKVIASDGKSGDQREIAYTNCKVIGNGSFGVVFQAKLVQGVAPGTDDQIAIKKVLQDKRFKVSSFRRMAARDAETTLDSRRIVNFRSCAW